MSEGLARAVDGLVERGELSLFQDSGGVVTIRRKQKVLSLQIIDKRKREASKEAVVLDRSWDYPADIEQAVCWEALLTMRNFISGVPEMQESWNDIFGAKWPELSIDIPLPPITARDRRIAEGRFKTAPVTEEKLAPPNAKPPIKIKHLDDYRGNYMGDENNLKRLEDSKDFV